MAHVKDKVADEHGTDYAQMELQLDEYKNLCKLLSKTIYECVMRDPIISLYEKKGEIILKGLYNIFSNENINEEGKLLPPDYRPRKKDNYTLEMGSIDYLAGMMDTFAISKYEELCGTSFSDISLKKENTCYFDSDNKIKKLLSLLNNNEDKSKYCLLMSLQKLL